MRPSQRSDAAAPHHGLDRVVARPHDRIERRSAEVERPSAGSLTAARALVRHAERAMVRQVSNGQHWMNADHAPLPGGGLLEDAFAQEQAVELRREMRHGSFVYDLGSRTRTPG